MFFFNNYQLLIEQNWIGFVKIIRLKKVYALCFNYINILLLYLGLENIFFPNFFYFNVKFYIFQYRKNVI